MFNVSEVHLVKDPLYVSRASQVTGYWSGSVMCVSSLCTGSSARKREGNEIKLRR